MAVKTSIGKAFLACLTVVVAIGLSACSQSTDDYAEEPAAPQSSAAMAGDSLWFSLRLVSAQPAVTTRALNDHGLAEEYDVKDGILVLLKAASGETEAEAAAKVWKAYDISEHFADDPMNSITQSMRIDMALKKEVDGYKEDDKIFALVLLNCKGQFTVAGTTLKLKEEGDVLTDLTGETLSYFQNTELTSIGDASNGFFMSNAPVIDSDTDKSSTLVEVTNVFLTEHQAKNSDATSLMVERAAAKVTVNDTVTTTGIKINGSEKNKLKVHKTRWCIDHYNKTSRAVRRNTETLKDEDNQIDNKCRAMWATHYNVTGYSATDKTSWVNAGESLYVGERVIESGTDGPRVIVEVSFKDVSNIIIDGDLYGNTGCPDVVFTTEKKRSTYMTLNSITGTDVKFTGGKMYFEESIKHGSDKYGVVRDNAYELNFKTITKIGEIAFY